MALEYKYVTYHPGNKQAHVDENLTAELNRWSQAGWRIFKVIRPSLIGPMHLVLERDSAD